MKKFDRSKTIQLLASIALTLICLLIVIFDKDLFHMISSNGAVRLMCIMLWLSLGLSFLFIYIDFSLLSTLKHDYRELNYAVNQDPVAGIANRYSSDAHIEKYLDKPIPANIGCVMIELSNIKDINKLYGHLQGNALIRDFSNILKLTSVNLCFISRNGGNKFLALFENTDMSLIELFLDRVAQKVEVSNSVPDKCPIKYRYGLAFNEGNEVATITDLIALADRRISEGK